jgi:hypothetical protein
MEFSMKAFRFFLHSGLACASLLAYAGTTGKIAGTVYDARTGEPLPSVNVVLVGTSLGAASNVDGYYVILNIRSGRCKLNASLVGYKSQSVTCLRVDIDQTTTQDLKLSEETLAAEEVTVVAIRPVVRKDVSASRANIEIADVVDTLL